MRVPPILTRGRTAQADMVGERAESSGPLDAACARR